jgi:small subunit ribosomal protein S19e
MASVFDVPANELIRTVSEELKAKPELAAPPWVGMVKSGAHAERVPQQRDFWFTRCASLLRTLAVRGKVGVRRLRHKYGGAREHHVSRPHHTLAGGKVIRTALQRLEKAGLVAKKEKEGRRLTPQGEALLNRAAEKALKK